MFFQQRQKRPWRRRKYIIKKGFQAKFVMKFLGVVTFGSAMSGYIMYLLINRDVEDTFYSSHIKFSSTGQLLLPTLLKVNFGVLVLVLLAVAAITLFISHKVAGPLLRLGRDTEKIAGGDLTGNFQLRTNDELKSLAQSFEDMNSDMKGHFNELRAQAAEIDRAAEDLMVRYAYSDLDRLRGHEEAGHEPLGRLTRNVGLFGRKLSRFQLEKKSGQKG